MTPIQIDPASADRAIARYRQLAERSESAPSGPSTFHFTRHRIAYAPSRGVSAVDNATVLSGEWFVLAKEYALCDAYAQTPFPPHSAYHLGIVPPNGIDLIHPSPRGLTAQQAFLLGGCPNYCHWLMDYLPRISLWNGDVPLLINSMPKQFQLESLSALGVGKDRVIELDYPNAYHIPMLFYPSLNSSWCTGHLPFRPDIIEWIRATFGPLMSVASQKPPTRRIFVTRSGAATATGRRLINAEEINYIAQSKDFEVVACETMSFAEQVDLFSQAALVAGPHGAGFTNLVFAPKGARIIELIGSRYGQDPSRGPQAFRHLATVMNMEFFRLIGRSDETARVQDDHLPNETYTINPREFLALLEKF